VVVPTIADRLGASTFILELTYWKICKFVSTASLEILVATVPSGGPPQAGRRGRMPSARQQTRGRAAACQTSWSL
jgi:hypothetical protein